MASCNHIELGPHEARGVEPAAARSRLIPRSFDFLPETSFKVKGPDIIQVGNALPSVDNQVGVEQLGGVVCPFPRQLLIFYIGTRSTLILNFAPDLGFPVEDTNGVIAHFVGSSAPEEINFVIDAIVTGRAVRSRGRARTFGFYFCPLH